MMVLIIFRVEAVEELGGEEPTEEAGDDIEQVAAPPFPFQILSFWHLQKFITIYTATTQLQHWKNDHYHP